MTTGSGRFRRASATGLFLTLCGSIFVGDALVMLLLATWPSLPPWGVMLLDATLLLLALFPVLYMLTFRPLTRQITLRDQADQARRGYEAELQATLDSTADGILAVSDDGKVLHASRQFAERWRMPPALLDRGDDRALLDFVMDQLVEPDAFRVKVQSLYGSDAEDADVLAFRDGRSFEWISIPMRLGGSRIGRVWSFRDISERRRTEERLREQERQYRALFEAHPEPMWVYDRETLRFLAVNDAAVRHYGWSRDEFATMTLLDIRPPDDVRSFRQFMGAVSDEPMEHGDWRHLARDGRVIFVEIGSHGLTFQGRAARLVVAHDVTVRRAAERAVREGEALRKIAARATRLGGWAVELASLQVVSSDEMRELLDAPAGERLSVTQVVDAYCAPEWGEILLGHLHRCGADGVPFDTEVQMVSRTGRRFWARLVGEAERDDTGSITRIHGALQDVTARREAEEQKVSLEAQLQQAQRLESVGLLAGGVAHDFNNMLGVILGSAEMALAQVEAAQPLHADLLEIRKAAIHSSDLTRQLLAFARQQTIAPAVLDLNATVPGMLAMLERLIGEDINLSWRPAANLWSVLMDPSQMDQILANLCVNARHAIEGIGTVTIATANVIADAAFCARHAEAVPGAYVQLSVRDTGKGMDAATLTRIFEPFFTTKGVGTGTGLGLSTVYGALKQNQGFITAASTPREGTTFEIYLPRHGGAPTPASRSGTEAAALRGGETILLVEDEPAMIRLVTKVLGAQGYVVLAASSTADALRLATTHPGEIHLLLSDVVMPEMNGRDLAQALLNLRPTLKPLFMSGHTAGVIATRGLLAPGMAFIGKPFTPVELAAKVREVLERA